MSPSTTPEIPQIFRSRNTARSQAFSALRLTLALVLVLAALALVGCGGGDNDDKEKAENAIVLASVGDTKILGSYYEDRLSMLGKDELPRDSKGKAMDMATQEAKEKFLETLINKEVMAKTAVALGYGNDPQISTAREKLISYEAAEKMWASLITEPASSITEEQLQAFYAQMGSSRKCRYLITNFRDEALEARQMAMNGADWQDVVAKYHAGEVTADGDNKISVPFGRYEASYENGVFNVEVGGFTEPIETVYGYWVLVIDSEDAGTRPPLEDAKARILDTVRGRKIGHSRQAFTDELKVKYKLEIQEDALWVVYSGMPLKEDLFYPGTQDAVKREDLEALNVSTVDREMPFYGYTKPDGTERLYTVGDYKTHFDAMSAFQRPKRAKMLGGLRAAITTDLMKILVNFAAEDQGFFENEEVLFKVNTRIEQMLVSKLYEETVQYESRILPAELDAFWAEHEADYFVPESRTGRLVVCADRAAAEEAHALAAGGARWREVLVKFGTDKENKSRAGKLERVRSDGTGPTRDAMFALAEGEISPVYDLGNGSFGVVKFEESFEPYQIQLSDISEDVGLRMKKIRQEESFQAMLTKWKTDLDIQTYSENLVSLKSWHDLMFPAVAENVVPRNQ